MNTVVNVTVASSSSSSAAAAATASADDVVPTTQPPSTLYSIPGIVNSSPSPLNSNELVCFVGLKLRLGLPLVLRVMLVLV